MRGGNGIGPQNACPPVEKRWKSKDWSRHWLYSLQFQGKQTQRCSLRGRWLSATMPSRIKPSLIWDFGTDGIGVGRWHGRSLLVGNAHRCQVSVLVIERGPVAAVFHPRGQRVPSIPLHEWK